MKSISIVLALILSILVFSCQNNAETKNDVDMSETDTVRSGLEGTRDQAATVGGSTVVPDTTAGQTIGNEETGKQADSANDKLLPEK